MKSVGSWAFVVGVILAILFGIVAEYGTGFPEWVGWFLVILGLIVGFLNVTDREVTPFLRAGTVLVIVSWLGNEAIAIIIPLFGSILQSLMMLFVPATVIVALKSVFAIANN